MSETIGILGAEVRVGDIVYATRNQTKLTHILPLLVQRITETNNPWKREVETSNGYTFMDGGIRRLCSTLSIAKKYDDILDSGDMEALQVFFEDTAIK